MGSQSTWSFVCYIIGHSILGEGNTLASVQHLRNASLVIWYLELCEMHAESWLVVFMSRFQRLGDRKVLASWLRGYHQR